jgi:GT2 family glycosyltransferase
MTVHTFPKIGVVIPTFNRKEHLRRILQQLKEQEHTGILLCVIVVIDGSTDGTDRMLADEFPDVDTIDGDGSWWYTRSMNAGFKKALQSGCHYVLTMNDDCTIESHFISRLTADKRTLPSPSILGSLSLAHGNPPRITFAGSRRLIRWRFKFINYFPLFEEMNATKMHGIHKSLVLTGRGLLIPAAVLLQLDFFDEKFIQYASDYDFCLRAVQHGIGVYISWNARIFEDLTTTGAGTYYLHEPFTGFLKSFLNPYSKNSIKNYCRTIIRHGYPMLLPVTLMIMVAAQIKNWFKYKLAGKQKGLI